MSPQMNGEPRDDRPASVSDSTSAPINPPPVLHDAHRPLAREMNTEGVTKTTMMEMEDANLAPLFTQSVAMDFRSRWDAVQRGFVDDPQAAVSAGDELVAQVIKNLAETFANQRSALEGDRKQAQESTTETLRLSLRRYRSFFERLLSI